MERKKKTLKVCTTGDPHFQLNNVREMTQYIQLVEEWVQNEKPDIFVCLGDILHTHRTIFMKPFMMACEFLFRLQKICPTYLLIGNHDRPNNSVFLTDEHAFGGFKETEIKIVDKGLVEKINGFTFAFVPYVPAGRFQEALDIIVGEQEVDAIFGHQEFKNCVMGTQKSTEGDTWSKKKCPIFSGHIHEKQTLGNIHYFGTPVQHTYAEDPCKGVHSVTFSQTEEDEKMKFEIDFYRLPIPAKITINIKASEFNDFKLPKDSQIKLVIEGEPTELKALYSLEKYKKLKKKCKIFCKENKIETQKRKYRGKTYIDMVYETLKEKERTYLKDLLSKKEEKTKRKERTE